LLLHTSELLGWMVYCFASPSAGLVPNAIAKITVALYMILQHANCPGMLQVLYTCHLYKFEFAQILTSEAHLKTGDRSEFS